MANRFVHSPVLVIASVLMCGALPGTRASAQRVAVVSTQANVIPTQRVTVNVVNASIRAVVKGIAQQAGLRPSYDETVIPDAARITLRVRDVSVAEAFERALRGTGLSAAIQETGNVLILVVPGTALADSGSVTGKVISGKTRQPVSGARVLVGDARKTVVTGNDGTFRVAAEAGEQVMEVRAVGFARNVRRVQVDASNVVSLEIALDPSASVLDEVIVTGTVIATERKAIPTPITVIHGEDLEKRGITRIEQLFHGEVPGLLAMDRGAGVYSNESEGAEVKATIYSRGSADLSGGANPIKTYVDGVELVDPSYLGTIDPRSIERIEIITGPQAATMYGSGAMGGVMQIFTKQGRSSDGEDITLSLKYGMLQNNYSQGITPAHNDLLKIEGSQGPVFSYAANLSYDYTGQWQPKLFSRRASASLGATHTRDRLTVRASASTSATKQGTYGSGFFEGYGLLKLGIGPDGSVNYGIGAEKTSIALRMYSEQVSITSNQMVSVNADYRMRSAWQHHVTVGRSQNVMKLHPVAPDFSGIGAYTGGDTLYEVRRTSGQRLTWNYNSSYRSSGRWASSSLTFGLSGSSGDQISVSGAVVSPVATNVVGLGGSGGANVSLPLDDQRWGGFGQWQVGLFNQLYATFGMRLEQSPSYGRDVKFDVTPTNGLTYTFEHKELSIKLLGSYGRATRPPSPWARLEQLSDGQIWGLGYYVYQFSNPELRPERSRGPQGGIELYYGNLGSITVNHYRQTVVDLIQQAPVDSILGYSTSNGLETWLTQYQYLNVAKIKQQGWEGTATTNVGPVSLRGSYSWNDNRVLEVHPRVFAVYPVGSSFGLPARTGSLIVSYAHQATSISLSTSYVGQAYPRGTTLLYSQLQLIRLAMYAPYAYARRGTLGANYFRPAYTKSDLAATHRLTSQLALTVNVINMGNSFQSDDKELNPTLGRQTTLGFSYRFGR